LGDLSLIDLGYEGFCGDGWRGYGDDWIIYCGNYLHLLFAFVKAQWDSKRLCWGLKKVVIGP
jgi:hypothetical protein